MLLGVIASPLAGAATTPLPPATSCDASCVAAVITNANWILQNQEPTSGWIGMSPPTTTVGLLSQAYDSSYATMGLSTAASVLYRADQSAGSPAHASLIAAYLNADYRWLTWYAAQMAANAPSSAAALSACSGSDVLLAESATTMIDCYYVPNDCTNLAPGQVFHPYGPGDPRYCVGAAGTNAVPVEVPASNLYATHPYMDSTDTEAALFLVDLNAWYQTTAMVDQDGGAAALSGLSSLPGVPGADAIGEALIAIHSTMDTTKGLTDSTLGPTFATAGDGLTWATPWWPVSWPYPHKYLEDESETYAGLNAAASLEATVSTRSGNLHSLSSLRRSKLASSSATEAKVIATAYNTTLWGTLPGQPSAGFAWAKDQNGALAYTNWSSGVYADAQQNMWAVMWGLATPSHARTILQTFNALYGPSAPGAAWLWAMPSASGALPQPLYWVGVAEAAGASQMSASKLGSTITSAFATQARLSQSDEDAIYANDRLWQYQPKDCGIALWGESQGLSS
jgi:hypothetical protein